MLQNYGKILASRFQKWEEGNGGGDLTNNISYTTIDLFKGFLYRFAVMCRTFNKKLINNKYI